MALPDAEPMVTIGPVTTSLQSLLFIGCLLSSYVFAWFYYRVLLHSRWLRCKQFYLFAVSQPFLAVLFTRRAILNIYLPIAFTYLIAKPYRHRPWMPAVVFCGVLGHLALVHLYHQFLAEGLADKVIDHSAPLMVLVIKLTTFAFDISDAYFTSTASKAKRMTSRKASSSGGKLSTAQKPEEDPQKKAQLISLRRFPTLLEFAGYAFLFPGFLAGPAFPFYEYRCFVEGSFFEGIDPRNGAMAGRKRRALKQFLTGMLFLIIYAGLKNIVTLQHSMEPDHLAKPIWYRLLYLHVVHIICRSKYYFIWLLAEGSYVLLGLGFRKHPTGSARWDRCENVNAKRVELAHDFKQIIGEWNMATNRWLYACVYKRIADWKYPGRRPGFRAGLATYVVSAIWHVHRRLLMCNLDNFHRDSIRATISHLSHAPCIRISHAVQTFSM